MWECPDFFDVNSHHCLLYSSEDKVFWTTGEFDANRVAISPCAPGVLDHGAYDAPKSFSLRQPAHLCGDAFSKHVLELEFAAAGWSGAMGLPRVLTVNRDGELAIPRSKWKSCAGPRRFQFCKPALRSAIATTLRRELRIALGILEAEDRGSSADQGAKASGSL